jgi:hypothetical protein
MLVTVDTAVINLESSKCRLSIIAILIELFKSVAFSRTS